MRLVDANFFIRPLTRDDPDKARACDDFLRLVERGEEEITACEAIISEGVFVLSSRATFGLSHEEIRARFAPYIRIRGLRLNGKSIYLEALDPTCAAFRVCALRGAYAAIGHRRTPQLRPGLRSYLRSRAC